MSNEDMAWCNEIHSDNYECPPQIRDTLIRREEQLKILFKNYNTPKKNKKPKRKKEKKKTK